MNARSVGAIAICFAALLGADVASPFFAKAAPLDDAAAQWRAYKERFISSDGRLIDDSAENISHSEGQGYAMLLAAFANDAPTFARIWTWTIANLYVRSDGLAAWRWRPQDSPHVLDKNNAADGDLLIAWALAVGARKWNNPGYSAEARRLALSFYKLTTYDASFGRAISPGVAGFGPKDSEDGPVVNLSYWIFPAFDALASVAPEVDWAALRASGLALLDAAKFGPRALPSDWIGLKDGPHPAVAHPRTFGYDAMRAPLYLAWSAPRDKKRLSEFVDGWASPTLGALATVDLDAGKSGEALGDIGYQTLAATLICAAGGEKLPDNLREPSLQRYYPATLQMLSMALIRQKLPQCL